MGQNFSDLLEMQWKQGRFLCIGLDVVLEDAPARLIERIARSKVSVNSTLLWLNQKIVDATKDIVCAYKLNLAFFHEKYGEHDITDSLLELVVDYIQGMAPAVPIILDAKWGDIANTNSKYVDMAFNTLGVDAVTVSPYIGGKALQPFLQNGSKGVFVLCRTSNPGSGEFQNMFVGKQRLFHHVARQVATRWNEQGNCGVVVGATFPESISEVRRIVGTVPILIPGVGAQGGELENAVRAGIDSNREGILITVSRAIIHAAKHDDNFAEVHQRAVKLHDAINYYRHVS